MGNIAKPDQVYCCACPKIMVVGSSTFENEIVVEGILSGKSLLYSEEEKLNSTAFEVPFVPMWKEM